MKKHIIVILVALLASACQTTEGNRNSVKIKKAAKYKGEVQPGKWLRDIEVPINYNGESSSARIQIFFPKSYVKGKSCRTIIALHQHGASRRDWETNAQMESHANRYSFVIVCPEMDKTVYEMNYYPETTYRWNIMPGGKFVAEVLVPFMAENFGLAAEKESTGIMGVTVGAHGAILIAENYPGLFGAAAGISGFYDPTIMQESRIIESVYGSYRKNPERWENEDNPLKMADRLAGVHVYLYHGGRNDAFQEGQSRIMAIKLKQLQNKSSDYSITYSESKSSQYGWIYWRGKVPEVMEFFNEKLRD